jgi:hypothetical protein
MSTMIAGQQAGGCGITAMRHPPSEFASTSAASLTAPGRLYSRLPGCHSMSPTATSRRSRPRRCTPLAGCARSCAASSYEKGAGSSDRTRRALHRSSGRATIAPTSRLGQGRSRRGATGGAGQKCSVGVVAGTRQGRNMGVQSQDAPARVSGNSKAALELPTHARRALFVARL